MKEFRLKLSSKDVENIDRLKEKYGFKTTEDLFRFLVTIFAQHYVEFLWGVNEAEKIAGMILSFIKNKNKILKSKYHVKKAGIGQTDSVVGIDV